MSNDFRNYLTEKTLERITREEEKYARSVQFNSLREINENIKKQAASQAEIRNLLEHEATSRSKDDKKYFWLGALTSFVISMTVEHGPALATALQQLLQRLIQ